LGNRSLWAGPQTRDSGTFGPMASSFRGTIPVQSALSKPPARAFLEKVLLDEIPKKEIAERELWDWFGEANGAH
jgi:hypothetical protein